VYAHLRRRVALILLLKSPIDVPLRSNNWKSHSQLFFFKHGFLLLLGHEKRKSLYWDLQCGVICWFDSDGGHNSTSFVALNGPKLYGYCRLKHFGLQYNNLLKQCVEFSKHGSE
jgi:hypothetical protein